MKKLTGLFVGIFLCLLFVSFSNHIAHAQLDHILFAVIGDYGLAGQNEADVANLVKSWSPDFIVTVGDNNYPNGQSYTIDDNIGQYYHDYIFPYKGKYGSGATTRRFFPVLGNHDWSETGGKPYLNYFAFYNGVTYYDFVQGPVHFFMLDSDKNEPDGYTATSDQAKWLKKSLTASTSPFNVVVFHHAPYSSGQHGSTTYMRWPFKEWGADVVLSGHDHIYERLLVDGLPYFVDGLGGDEIYPFVNILPESQVRYNSDFGAMRVEATSTSMRFQMFSRTGTLVDDYTIGGSTPAVSAITRSQPLPTNASSVNFQVTFSEAVTGVDTADFALTTNLAGASITNISGSGNSYTVSVNTGSGDGNLRLDLTDNDSITSSLSIPLGGSGAGNGNFSSGETYTIDRTAPTVNSILRTDANPTNAASVNFSVNFSEPVANVDAADFSLISSAGAAITSVSGTGSSYMVSVATGIGNDNLQLNFAGNATVTDLAGNTITAGYTSGDVYTVDRSAPAVTSITRADQTNASGVEYTVRFSEAVTGVDGGDFLLSTINGAFITDVSGSGDLYLVSVSLQPGSDSVRLDVSDNDSITDSVGNPLGGAGIGNGNFMGEIVNIAIDTPIVTSITRAGQSPTNAPNVDFIVTFSEPVDGVDASDFVLNAGSIINISNSNPFYVVTVDASTVSGELRLNLIDDDSIHNSQGIPLGGNGVGNANLNGEAYIIDRTPPQVTSIIRASNNPTLNSNVDFIVTFSKPVNGVDASDFVLSTSNIIKAAVVNVQNANPFYLITVSTGAGSGTLRLDLLDNGSITDNSGIKINGSFTSGETYSVAKTSVNFTAPTLYEFKNSLVNTSIPTISWSPVRGAQAYELFIARDASFGQVVLAQTLSETSLLTPPLTDGIYYARVRAYDGNFNPGKFSKTITMIVDTTPPSPPSLKTPTNNSTTSKRPWLTWMPVSDAAQYQVLIDNNSDFSSPQFSAYTTKTTIQAPNLFKKTSYYWLVRAKDAAGNWSDWSAIFAFYVGR